MAKGFKVGKCWFHHNERGYHAVLNGQDARSACEAQAGRLKAAATAISGIDYDINSMQGVSRIHTRGTTVTQKDFFRERHHHALSMVCGGRKGRR